MTYRVVSWELRAEALSALARGVSTESLSAVLGVGGPSIWRWGRLSGMQFQRGYNGGVVSPPVSGLRSRSRMPAYRRLSSEDRTFIQMALAARRPLSMRKIASELGVAASTISREIAAHQVVHRGEVRYHAESAHYVARRARARYRPEKLDDPVLRQAVERVKWCV